jgi:hypothetical protein
MEGDGRIGSKIDRVAFHPAQEITKEGELDTVPEGDHLGHRHSQENRRTSVPPLCFQLVDRQAEGQIVFPIRQDLPKTAGIGPNAVVTVQVPFRVKAQGEPGSQRERLFQAVREVRPLVRASGAGCGWLHRLPLECA